MTAVGGLWIFIASARALRIAPEIPERRANASLYADLKRKLFRSPGECRQHAIDLFADYEGLLTERQTSGVQSVFGNLEHRNKTKFLMLATKHEFCMADNWFVHALKATVQPSLFVHVALDKESHTSCLKHFQSRAGSGKGNHTIECVDFSDFLPWSEFESPDVVGFGSCIYQIFTWMKPLLLKVATSSVVDPSSVVYFDFDIVIHKDMQALLSEGKASILQTAPSILKTSNEEDALKELRLTKPRLPNAGFVSINSNVEELIHLWLQQVPIVYDLNQGDNAGLIAMLLSPEGKYFKQHMHVISMKKFGVCRNRGEYATHYNCVADKFEAMQRDGKYRPATQGCMYSHIRTSRKWASTFDQEWENMSQSS